jgi:predicted Zn-dependent protease
VLLLAAACSRAAYTGRVQSAPVADDDELAVADRAVAEYRLRVRPATDAALVDRVRRVGDAIVTAARNGPAGERARRLDWRLTVVDSPDTHTATFANGMIFVSTALVRALPTDDALAAALGHAVARVLLRHGGEASARRSMRDALAAFTSVASNSTSLGEIEEQRIAEADWVGLVLAVDAGYDPDQAVEVFDRLGLRARGEQVQERLPELRERRAARGA